MRCQGYVSASCSRTFALCACLRTRCEQSNEKLDPEPNEWTGTFRDARPINPLGPQPENAVLGLMFAVNAQRVDSLEVLRVCRRRPQAAGMTHRVPTHQVSHEYGRLRLWRHTEAASLAPGQAYVTLPGVLGHEWDVDVDNGHRPAGLVHFSSTCVGRPSLDTQPLHG